MVEDQNAAIEKANLVQRDVQLGLPGAEPPQELDPRAQRDQEELHQYHD